MLAIWLMISLVAMVLGYLFMLAMKGANPGPSASGHFGGQWLDDLLFALLIGILWPLFIISLIYGLIRLMIGMFIRKK